MGSKFKKGFEQNTKQGRVRVSFLRLGSTKIVLKQPIEAKVIKPEVKKEAVK